MTSMSGFMSFSYIITLQEHVRSYYSQKICWRTVMFEIDCAPPAWASCVLHKECFRPCSGSQETSMNGCFSYLSVSSILITSFDELYRALQALRAASDLSGLRQSSSKSSRPECSLWGNLMHRARDSLKLYHITIFPCVPLPYRRRGMLSWNHGIFHRICSASYNLFISCT